MDLASTLERCGDGSVLALGGLLIGALCMAGGAIFALTAWVTLVGMWVGADLVDRLLDRPPLPHASAPRRNALAT